MPRSLLLLLLARAAAGSGALAVLLGAWSSACADLPPISSDFCGNAVVEPGEDCDKFSSEQGATCAPPEAPHACRYVCPADAKGEPGPCPTGFGCGADAICRRGSGAWRPLGEGLLFPALRRLTVGDLDVYGLPEVLGQSDIDATGRRVARLVTPPHDGQAARAQAIDALLAVATLGSLQDRFATDIVFNDRDGVALLRGGRDGSLETTAFPSFLPQTRSSLRALPIDVISDEADEIVTYSAGASRGSGALYGYQDIHQSGTQLVTIPYEEEDIVGAIAVAKLDEGASCAQIVFPFRGASALTIFTPCRGSGKDRSWNINGAPSSVMLPTDTAIDTGVRVVDLDLDGHMDLLIGASGQLFAAWGRGDGTFTSGKGTGATNTAGPFALPPIATRAELPLAVAHLNADKLPDFVMPDAVIVSHPDGYARVYENFGAPWTTALIVDLNANGMPDVIAGASTALDLTFLNNAGGGVLNPFTIITSGPPNFLTSGDFDGDLLTDIAYVEEIDVASATDDQVVVAFGAPYGPPTSVKVIAHLSEVEQLSAGHLPNASAADGVSDLVVVSHYGAPPTDTLFLLEGTGARAFASTLPLQDGTGGARAIPLGFAIGRFDGARPSIAALGADDGDAKLRVWHVGAIAELTQSHVVASAPLADGFHPASREGDPRIDLRYGAAMAAGDLDADGRYEVVIVAPYGGDTSAALVIARYETSSASFVPGPRLLIDGAVTLSPDSTLLLVDIDGDQRPEVMLSTGESEVLVLWNDGAGGFSGMNPTRLHLDEGISDFTCLASSKRRGCDPALISQDATYLASYLGGRAFATAPIAGLDGGRAIAAGDFDRDGVPDLALATSGELRFYRAIAEHP
jgi:FG-GAP-like repeat/FG-GAP repeat